jgi:hypothetical protein
MPEAHVLLCRHSGRRFNIKVDVAYGAQTEPVDIFSKIELEAIERLILAASGDSR